MIIPGDLKKCIFHPALMTRGAGSLCGGHGRLCREIDIGYLQLITNDSGAGVCWSSGLYNGPNGPQACRHIPLEKRLLTFMRVFQEAARKNGREMITDITSHIIGFKTLFGYGWRLETVGAGADCE